MSLRGESRTWLGLLLLAGVFAVDFHFDTRERDVFSWMDPYQYYDFALAVVEGRERFDRFEIPSIFPFFVMPLLALDGSIPASLWINVVALGVLLVGLRALCRDLGVHTPVPVVALLVVSSPLLLGLSRTLYVEFTLTAIATAAFVYWLRFVPTADPRAGVTYGALLALGFLTKTTFWLFFLPPVAGAVVARLVERRFNDAILLLAATLLPLGLAVLVHLSLFSQSLGYYLNLVSTSQPFMYLMGPPDLLSWSSATYYLGEIARTYLFWLTPLLALPVWAAWKTWKERGWNLGALAGPRAALWLWLLGPLALLTLHPLKEPRHAVVCVVPAVLLVALGIDAIGNTTWRRAATLVAVALGVAQLSAITLGGLEVPYFLDRSVHYAEIRDRMIEASSQDAYRRTPPGLRRAHWRYTQNVALAGFPPNEALALTWQGFPGVAIDLDTLDDPDRLSPRIPYRQFEDLFFLAAINTYNRRCGWRHYHAALPADVVVANADFVLVRGGSDETLAHRFPDHALVATVARADADVHILRATGPTTPYRTLYARRFLAGRDDLPPEERLAIAREQRMAAVLGGDAAAAEALAVEFPELRDPNLTARNIYWIAGYPRLIQLAQLLDARPDPGRR